MFVGSRFQFSLTPLIDYRDYVVFHYVSISNSYSSIPTCCSHFIQCFEVKRKLSFAIELRAQNLEIKWSLHQFMMVWSRIQAFWSRRTKINSLLLRELKTFCGRLDVTTEVIRYYGLICTGMWTALVNCIWLTGSYGAVPIALATTSAQEDVERIHAFGKTELSTKSWLFHFVNVPKSSHWRQKHTSIQYRFIRHKHVWLYLGMQLIIYTPHTCESLVVVSAAKCCISRSKFLNPRQAFVLGFLVIKWFSVRGDRIKFSRYRSCHEDILITKSDQRSL